MRFDLKAIALDQIDLSDEQYRISTEDKIDGLAESIRHIGLLNPPILLQVGNRLIVVNGFRRVRACLFLGWIEADCRILDPDTPPLNCLQIAIAENSVNRSVNILEQAIAVQRMSAYYPDDRQLCQALKSLGLPLNPVLVDKYKRLRALPMAVQSCVESNTLSLTLALDLETAGEGDAVAVADLIALLRPTFNQQKEILTNLKDIARLEDISIENLINSPSISDLVHHPDLDRKRIIHLLRKVLKRRRYPAISAAEEAFVECIRQLGLTDDEQLIPPQDFEDTRYRFILSFETPDDLLHHAERMALISQHHLLKKILKRSLADS